VPFVPGLYYDLANLYWIMRDYANAEKICRQSIALTEDHQATVPRFYALSIALLGKLLELKNDINGAEHHYKLAINLISKAFGSEHHYVASAMSDLATPLFKKGESGIAEEMLNKALKIFEKTLGGSHPYTTIVEQNIGMLHFYKKDYKRALNTFLRTLKKFENVYGPDIRDLQASSCLNNLGRVYAELGNMDQSRLYYGRLLETYNVILGQEHPDTKELREALNNQ